VRSAFRRQGIGRTFVAEFESEAHNRGALTVTLGTDDNTGMTSLAGVDFYSDLARDLAEIRDLSRGHPFRFYLKLGFVITGVLPDANGPGRQIFICQNGSGTESARKRPARFLATCAVHTASGAR